MVKFSFNRSALCAAVALGVAMPIAATVPFAGSAIAQQSTIPVSGIRVEGNQRIESETIIAFMTVAQGSQASAEDINASVKALFDTGLFRNVNIEPRGSELVVIVEENAVVNEISFEGNDRIDDDILAAEVSSRPRRVFTRAKAEADAETILEAYRRSGRFGATVEPKIIELGQNRVDLVFEIEEGPQTGVSSIRFIGNQAFSDSRLRRVISTDESTLLNFLSSTDAYDPDRIEFDKELLRRWYLSNGYADFEIVSTIAELSPDRSGFFITFTVAEGPLYTFGPVDVAASAEGVDVEELRTLIEAREGDTYDIEAIDDTISAMDFRLGERGYAFTDIEATPDRNEEERSIGITFNVAEGPRVFVERIDIEGNSRTLDRVIRREFELVEGDAFNSLQLRRSRSNIRGLGYFSDVTVTTEQGSAPDRLVVKAEVEEQSTGQLSFGIGFSSSDSIGGTVSIVERNLLGRGQILRVSANVSGSRQLYDLSFTEPKFLDRDLAVGFDLYRSETDDQDTSSFDTRNTGFTPRVSFPLDRNTRLGLEYQISQDEVIDVPIDASPIIIRDIGSELTSAIGYTITHDRRNDATVPTSGFVGRFSQRVSGLGGDTQFVDTRASVKGFQDFLSDDVVGSLELSAGGIIPFGGYDLRTTDRTFLGGDSFRGFESGGVGPRDQFTDDGLGGQYFAIARSEVTFPLGLPDEFGLRGGVFADVGTLWGLDDNTYTDTRVGGINGGNPVTIDDDPKLRASIGASLFWDSPFGPVRINVAQPIVKEDDDQEEIFRLTAGTRF